MLHLPLASYKERRVQLENGRLCPFLNKKKKKVRSARTMMCSDSLFINKKCVPAGWLQKENEST
jgi:hypothetical protein